MKLTESQKQSVKDEVYTFLRNIFEDWQDCEEITETVLEDVTEDIELTADWKRFDDDEYSVSDIQIALARVIYKAIGEKYWKN